MFSPDDYWGAFRIFFCIRYSRLLVHIIAHWTFRSVLIPSHPTRFSSNITVIVPTIFNDGQRLRKTLESILKCKPFEVLVVTTNEKYDSALKATSSFNAPNLRVLQIEIANKRDQVVEGLSQALTDIIILADDDVTWPSTILPWILAPLEDPRVGAVVTSQRVERLKGGTILEKCYDFLGAAYIERRNFENSATYNIDGGISCMSGRTFAIRSQILKDDEFIHGFQNEACYGKRLNADDDNFITRWLVSKEWAIRFQDDEGCMVETVLERNHGYWSQCLRWALSNWRSNFKSLFIEKHIWRQQPWSTYALHLTMFTNFAILVDTLLIWLLYQGTISSLDQQWYIWVFVLWVVMTKNVKLIRLYRNNFSDIRYMPVQIIFGYCHSFVKALALCTLSNVEWVSRKV